MSSPNLGIQSEVLRNRGLEDRGLPDMRDVSCLDYEAYDQQIRLALFCLSTV